MTFAGVKGVEIAAFRFVYRHATQRTVGEGELVIAEAGGNFPGDACPQHARHLKESVNRYR